MKINLLSDLHLEHSYPCQYFDPGTGDVLILAGDILNAHHLKKNGYLNDLYRKFIKDCSDNYEHVLYVQGNHEFFGYNYESASKTIKEALPENFHLLENDTIEINSIYFIGLTLWTNFFNENPIEMLDAQQYMNDYKSIRIGSNYRKLNPTDVLGFHKQSISYLNEKLKELENQRIFVISHHAPSLQAIAPKYRNFSCNGSFCSDLEDVILQHPNLKNWAFGHVHTAFDFNVGDCRLTCNPRGYPHENTGFNPKFFMEL